jgi:hypothetical protein
LGTTRLGNEIQKISERSHTVTIDLGELHNPPSVCLAK